jgi:hypothetical protein
VTAPVVPPVAAPAAEPSYPELLAALEARRRYADDLRLQKMALVRTPMNPG